MDGPLWYLTLRYLWGGSLQLPALRPHSWAHCAKQRTAMRPRNLFWEWVDWLFVPAALCNNSVSGWLRFLHGRRIHAGRSSAGRAPPVALSSASACPSTWSPATSASATSRSTGSCCPLSCCCCAALPWQHRRHRRFNDTQNLWG